MVPLIVIGIIGFAAFLIYSNSSSGGIADMNIAQYAMLAGFSGNDLVTAVAIALAESGGNPNAYNPETAAGTPVNQGSYGLWQIYLKAHPEYAGSNLYDPQMNADAAYQVYVNAGNSFSPWSTFKSGAYQAYLAMAQAQISA